MAKSKNGGTRAYIRGRIGSDVYSVGKNGKGERQQVVRSLAENVSNPRTSAQMFGRMVMSTVMQAVSALQPIIDHSFDGVAKGQPSISEFIRRNYALIKADATAHPASGNSFGLVKYQDKGMRAGAYIISNGNAQMPSAVEAGFSSLKIQLTSQTLTVGGLKNALGVSADGYFTYVVITASGDAEFVRIKLDSSLSDSTAISAQNVGTIFKVEGNVTPSFTLSGANIEMTTPGNNNSAAGGAIVSDLENGSWVHSQCVLSVAAIVVYSADEALPTYPTGSEMFLNGGGL